VLVDFLRTNYDIFTWSPSNMLGIPRDVTEHALEIWADAKPVKQRLRRFGSTLGRRKPSSTSF
jgi:hypothetical protein